MTQTPVPKALNTAQRDVEVDSDLLDVSVVLPIFEEKDNLRPLLEEIEAALGEAKLRFEVIAVDDGSRDGSRELLARLLKIMKHEIVTSRINLHLF